MKIYASQKYVDDVVRRGPEAPVSVDFSALETEDKIIEIFADGSTKITMVEFDADGNPVKIIDADGTETVLTW